MAEKAVKISESECTKFCTSKQHGNLLSSVITKRAVSDSALASYIKGKCQNYLRNVDDQGRYLIHMIVSRGRRDLLEWLLRYYLKYSQISSIIDVKDLESGYSPLHRSIFYGQIHAAILLMKNGANVSVLDNEDMTPLDLALIDRHPRFELSKNIPCDAYLWGANTNYTLGTSSQQRRDYPELLSSFSKQNVHIVQVSLSKFHTAFLSSSGNVWTCGHGEGGRLGVATRDTHVLPTQITLPERCINVATGRDHTLFLLESGNILSCGLNDYHQLGQAPPPNCQLSPRPVKLKLSNAIGVCAARYHSAAFNAHCLYTWGLNGGQLGHVKEAEKTVSVPRKVAALSMTSGQDNCRITHVSVSDGATVAVTSKGDIYLLHQYQCKRIAYRLHNIKNVVVNGGEAIGGDKLTEHQKQIYVLMLNTTGNIYLWQSSTGLFTRCIYNTSRPIFVTEVALTKEFIFFTTKLGDAYKGNITPKKNTKPNTDAAGSPKNKGKSDVLKGDSSKNFNQFIDKEDCILVKLAKLPNIHRAVDISCDTKGNNLSVLQVAPNSSQIDLPQVTSSQMETDMENLLNECSVDDMLHDVLIKIGNYVYPAHQYVVAHGSEYFRKMCVLNNNKKNGSNEIFTVEVEGIHHTILKQVLKYLYSGNCDLLVVGPSDIKIDAPKSKENELITDENVIDGELSAYEVYNTTKKNKSKKSKDKQNKENVQTMDPVRQLQAAAKKLGINSLYKLLDKYGWSRGSVIIRTEDYKRIDRVHKFNIAELDDLFDAVIKCSDGPTIKAHKCILAARLEYFNGMFCHSWAENTSYSTVSLPIKHKMLNPIIKFLYTDECSELDECDDFDYLGNMLVICDQLFITRLREMCEIALSKMISLKNVPEILQISDTYNCPQLKACCMEYVSLNLSALLENKVLESVPYGVLEDLSKYYIEFNPAMMKRIITPFSDAPDDKTILSMAEISPISFGEDNEDSDETFDSYIANSKKKNRTRKSSQNESVKREEIPVNGNRVDKDVHLYLTNVSKNNSVEDKSNWTEVSKKQQKIVQARLKVISDVKERGALLEMDHSFTKLTKNNNSFDSNVSDDETFSRNLETTLNITVVNTKLSQKQRKRLASESKDAGISNEHVRSLVTPPKEISKNPWKKIEEPIVVTPENNKINFSEILKDEKKQKENLHKMMAKPLTYIQIEDKAIVDLMEHYHSIYEFDENITVNRISCSRIALPRWIDKSHNLNT